MLNLRQATKDGDESRVRLLGAVRSCYVALVKERKGVRWWTLPSRWTDADLGRVIKAAEEASASPVDLIKAQFDALSKATCERIFGLSYPPLNTCHTKAAIGRYELWLSNRNGDVSDPTMVGLLDRFKKESALFDSVECEDDLLLLVLSGSLSTWYLAMRFVLCYDTDMLRLVGLAGPVVEAAWKRRLQYVKGLKREEKTWLRDAINKAR